MRTFHKDQLLKTMSKSAHAHNGHSIQAHC